MFVYLLLLMIILLIVVTIAIIISYNNNIKLGSYEIPDVLKYAEMLGTRYRRSEERALKHTNYVPPSSNKQIVTVRNSSPEDYYALSYMISTFIPKDKVESLLTKPDKDVYNFIKKYAEDRNSPHRDKNVAKNIFDRIPKSCKKILDVGCGSCRMIEYLGELLELPQENVFGVDIAQWGTYNEDKRKELNIIYKTIEDDGVLPFDDGEFDLIVCNMVLHHVKPIDKLVSEISRCLSTNGIFFIREHSPYTDPQRMIIDIQHMIYSVIEDNYYPADYYGRYFTLVEMDMLLKKYNMEYTCGGDLFSRRETMIMFDKAYWAMYKKVKISL